MKFSQPVFDSLTKEGVITKEASYGSIIFKTIILFATAVVSGFIGIMVFPEQVLNAGVLIFLGIIGFLSVLIGCRSVRLAPACAIVYAVTEGIFLVISGLLFEAIYPGIVFSAIAITASIFFVMLFLYSTNIIKVTRRFVKFIMNMTVAIFVTYLIVGIIYLINPSNAIVSIFSGEFSAVAILLSLFIIVFASLRLTVDFERIKQTVSYQFDKGREWQAAMGLMVSVVWIYIEVLRLLAIIASKKD